MCIHHHSSFRVHFIVGKFLKNVQVCIIINFNQGSCGVIGCFGYWHGKYRYGFGGYNGCGGMIYGCCYCYGNSFIVDSMIIIIL